MQLLIGQSAAVNLQMSPSTVQETVTVTAEAPLLNTQTLEPRRQRRSAPGRGIAEQWPQLDEPGADGSGRPHHARRTRLPRCLTETAAKRANSSSTWTASRSRPTSARAARRKFSSGLHRGVPVHLEPFRRDARTVHRRPGERHYQVGHEQASRASSAATSATDRFNAENPVLGRDSSYRQPAVQRRDRRSHHQDKLHFFGNFEYEREPRTSICNSPYPVFNEELTGDDNQKKGGVRLDYQLSSRHPADGERYLKATFSQPFGAGQHGPGGQPGQDGGDTTGRALAS